MEIETNLVPPSLAANISVKLPISFDEYQKWYADLEKRGEAEGAKVWEEMVALSDLTIKNASTDLLLKIDVISDNQIAVMYLNKVSPLFYLKKYSEALQAVEAAKGVFKESDARIDSTNNARYLYLKSACYRALYRVEENIDKKESYKQGALETIEGALKYQEDESVGFGIKAKISFNAGAYYQDIESNIEKALSHFAQAVAFYENERLWKDAVRTLIRMGRCYLDSNDKDQLQKILVQTKIIFDCNRLPLESKTGVQYRLFLAKSQFKLGDNTNAVGTALAGKQSAKDLGMKMEEQEFEVLLT